MLAGFSAVQGVITSPALETERKRFISKAQLLTPP